MTALLSPSPRQSSLRKQTFLLSVYLQHPPSHLLTNDTDIPVVSRSTTQWDITRSVAVATSACVVNVKSPAAQNIQMFLCVFCAKLLTLTLDRTQGNRAAGRCAANISPFVFALTYSAVGWWAALSAIKKRDPNTLIDSARPHSQPAREPRRNVCSLAESAQSVCAAANDPIK